MKFLVQLCTAVQLLVVCIAAISIDWSQSYGYSNLSLSIIVVPNPIKSPSSPLFDSIYHWLSELQVEYIRYIPWYPYPHFGVAQLREPSGPFLCRYLNGDTYQNNWTVSLSCPSGTIDKIYFASFGNPTGGCGEYSLGDCHAAQSVQIVADECVGRSSCSFWVNKDVFGDPCPEVEQKQFAVMVDCSVDQLFSNWDFSAMNAYIQPFVDSLWSKQTAVFDFGSAPLWIYDLDVADDVNQTGAELINFILGDNPYNGSWNYNRFKIGFQDNNSTLGIARWTRYLENVVRYYTVGHFQDEYGQNITSELSSTFEMNFFEVLNEPAFESPWLTAQEYNSLYDSVYNAIKRINPHTQFIGASAPWNLDPDGPEKMQETWRSFLDHSNHADDVTLDYISQHIYCFANRTDIAGYERTYDWYDVQDTVIDQLIAVRDQLSPDTKIAFNEVGSLLTTADEKFQLPPPAAFDGTPLPPDIWYNYQTSFFNYVYSKFLFKDIEIIGAAWLISFPTLRNESFREIAFGTDVNAFYPCLSMLDWNSGAPLPTYYNLLLLSPNIQKGSDVIVRAEIDREDVHVLALYNESYYKLLIVNKRNVTVEIDSFEMVLRDRTSCEYVNFNGFLEVIDEDYKDHDGIRIDAVKDEKRLRMKRFAVAVFLIPELTQEHCESTETDESPEATIIWIGVFVSFLALDMQ